MLWACILLPQLAIDAVLRRRPDPERPLALVTGPAHLRRLHAVNASAAAAGLAPGMRLSAAHALLADVATVEHDPQGEARWHRFLAAWAYRHSSLICGGITSVPSSVANPAWLGGRNSCAQRARPVSSED